MTDCLRNGHRYRGDSDNDHQNVEQQRHAGRKEDVDIVRSSHREIGNRADALQMAQAREYRRRNRDSEGSSVFAILTPLEHEFRGRRRLTPPGSLGVLLLDHPGVVSFGTLAIGSCQPRVIAMTRSRKHEISATAVTAATGSCSIWPITTMADAASAATA